MYVVMEGEPPEDGDDLASVQSALAVAEERIRGLEEQVNFLHGQLRLEQERNCQLVEDLKAVLCLAATKGEQHPWWRFWN